MDMKTPNWDLYRSFLAVARTGSLSAAAQALGLTQPTVGRHIDALEAALGVPLFVRSRTGLAATEAALDLVPQAQAMDAAAAALVRAASGEAEEARGTVRLTASEIVGTEVLPPILADFRAAHPNVAVELVLSNDQNDLLKREADVAVRMVRPAQSALVARRIGAIPLHLYAHRGYLARHGTPRSVPELMQHTLIGYDTNRRILDTLAEMGIDAGAATFALRSDSEPAQLALLRAGAGIGGIQAPLAARDPALVPVVPDLISFTLEMWLAMHEDLRASRRVRLLFDHLADGLGAYARGGAA